MRFLDIPNVPAPDLRVRRVQTSSSPEGTLVAVWLGDAERTRSVHVLRLDSGAEVYRRLVPQFAGTVDPALSADFAIYAHAVDRDPPRFVLEMPLTADRGTLAADCTPSLWDEPRPAVALSMSPDGRVLEASLADGDLISFDVSAAFDGVTFRNVLSETVPPAETMTHAAGRPGEARGPRLLLVADSTANFSFVGCEPEVMGFLTQNPRPAVCRRAAAFSPSGRMFAIATGTDVLVWEQDGLPRSYPNRHFAAGAVVTAVAFSPDDSRIASAGTDGAVRLNDARTTDRVRLYPLPLGELGGVAFDPATGHVVAGGEGPRLAVFAPDENTFGVDAPPPAPFDGPPEEEIAPAGAPAAPSSAASPGGAARWVRMNYVDIPPGAVACGREADGAPLYAARGEHRGAVLLGKVRHGFGGANVAYKKREITVFPFEILTGPLTWQAARRGAIPAGAVECGRDDKDRPLYLVRAAIGPGLHTGSIAQGQKSAKIPFGGAVVDSADYEVYVRDTSDEDESPEQAAEPADLGAPLLSWDFENTHTRNGISVSVGIPSDPKAINGFATHSGGGPAEVWPETGTVMLVRYFGANDIYLWLTVTAPVFVEAVRFRHWHNHNPGFPTHPSYRVDVRWGDDAAGADYLTASNETSGQVATIRLGRPLAPGNYYLRWVGSGFRRERNSSTEFFALKDLELLGRVEG